MFVGLAAALSCGKARTDEVVVYTSVDQVFSEPVFRFCEAQTNIRVRALFDTEETKSTGVLNRLIAEATHPQADVFWSGDPVRPFVLVDKGLVQPYLSPAAEGLPVALRDPEGMWTGFAARARVLLVNDELVPPEQRPKSIDDLVDPRWKGMTAVANPLFGTTTMHIAALSSRWGESKTREFLDQLRDNEVRIASSNGEVKRLVVSGEVAFGLTDTDDAHEAMGEGAGVSVVYPDQQGMGTLLMPTVAVLMKGGPSPSRGKKLIDCLLSGEVEAKLAKSAAHMPVRPGVEVPAAVRSVDSIKAMKVDHAKVARAMGEIQPWLRTWVGL